MSATPAAGSAGIGTTVERRAMSVGPTRLAPSVLAAVAAQPLPLSDSAFLACVAECVRGLRVVFGAEGCDQVIIPATGTIGLEVVAANLVPRGGSVLVLSTGVWGERWAEICRRLGHDVRVVRAPFGAAMDAAAVEDALAARRADAVLVTHVDSSTGVLVDLPAICASAARFGTRVLVDGMGAAGAEIVEQRAWGIDAYVASTPKALGAPAGLALISLSPSAAREVEERSSPGPSFALDLAPWLAVFRAAEGGTFAYFQSPAGNLLAALREALRLVIDEGMPSRTRRHRACRDGLHAGLRRLGCEIVAAAEVRSATITVCWYPEGHDATLLRQVEELGLVLPAGVHPEFGARTFRIGHLGDVQEADIEFTLWTLTRALSRER